VHDKRFINRLVVRTLSTVVHLARHFASGMGLIPPTAADMDPEALKGKLVLVNSIPGLDYPQPLPPLVQYTGPIIEMNTMEAFTPDVEAWMDAVPVGKPVVYVSYGTVAFLKEDQVRYMANVLTSDKFFALWALPSDQHAGLPDDLPSSVKVHHWIPTPRALAHPKVAAFVSHCGGNSVSESIAMGKPIVGYPQFGDQTANCQRVADAGAGTTAPLKQSWVKQSDILEVIQNGAYTKRAAQLARLLKAFGGTKKAADLIEVGATGDFHLMSPPTHNSFWDWFLLEGYDIKILGCLGLFMAGYMARGMSCCGGRRGRSTKLKTT
jgi:polyene glycosyltransferase